ncbi:glycosyltransferase family 2 protein [Kitasatospora sp. LaBMicrA B282]|uniref:glycosyltransferase family 2 protein n=1 Tax=Kitasatospora sp. LaBMicrA B282 TaxID=3420949 RepID=UPI003D127C61
MHRTSPHSPAVTESDAEATLQLLLPRLDPHPAAPPDPLDPLPGAPAAEGADGAAVIEDTAADPEPAYDYERFSRLAGPPVDPDPLTPYRVAYRSLLLVWLLLPGHWPRRPGESDTWLLAADKTMVAMVAVIEVFRLVTVVSNAHATLVARDPVPVLPPAGGRVAFLTTCVPGKEPARMVRATLTAAKAVRHAGPLDVWLLDEGDSLEMRQLCAELGVYHFSRAGQPRFNRRKGAFRARTKHGNYNSWLDLYGDHYDFWLSVDTDHVPLPNFCERMLGYFRDPDVAFVVGPQVYGNYHSAPTSVTRFSESQQFLFHALIQRAGNRYGAPMFVGTNNAVRISALRQVGGLRDSITEDMATGLELHRRRNPLTGERWKSVYTPDVLAVGEGPASWTDFFSQQLRWSRGTYETLLTRYWKVAPQLGPGRLLNYTLMVCFYPMAALTWLFGGLSSVLYLVLGASGVHVSLSIWMMLYSDAAALQILLYTWNRRHNVSPHEPAGSSGVAGMVMTALCGPIYAASLLQALLRRRSRFVVTPKGGARSTDRLATFRIHACWTLVFGGSLAASFVTGYGQPAMRVWAAIALLCTLLPPAIHVFDRLRARRPAPAPRTAPIEETVR